MGALRHDKKRETGTGRVSSRRHRFVQDARCSEKATLANEKPCGCSPSHAAKGSISQSFYYVGMESTVFYRHRSALQERKREQDIAAGTVRLC